METLVPSGWSKVSQRILPGLATGVRNANLRLGTIAQDLQRASRIAAECGAPLLIANAARALFEAGANHLGSGTDVDAMAERFGAMAGVAFPPA